jgi:hypothetical protein
MGMRSVLLAGAAGAALAYFFDPERGPARRAQARDQLGSMARRTERDMEKQARHRTNQAVGMAHETGLAGSES